MFPRTPIIQTPINPIPLLQRTSTSLENRIQLPSRPPHNLQRQGKHARQTTRNVLGRDLVEQTTKLHRSTQTISHMHFPRPSGREREPGRGTQGAPTHRNRIIDQLAAPDRGAEIRRGDKSTDTDIATKEDGILGIKLKNLDRHIRTCERQLATEPILRNPFRDMFPAALAITDSTKEATDGR